MDIVVAVVEKLGSTEQVQAYQARRSLEELIGLAGGPGQRKIARTLAQELNANRERKDGEKTIQEIKYSPKVRSEIARYLALVGGDEEVPALEKAMEDLEVREAARWALDRMNGAAATAALAKAAVDGIGPDFRIGAINALGRRSGPEVLAALKQCAADPYLEIRLAAAEALANQSDASSDSLLVDAAKGSGVLQERARTRLTKARLRLADAVAVGGDKAAAKQLYEAILAANPDEPQKEAASRALAQLG